MPVKVYYDNDADLEVLRGKKIAIIGYGSQGHAHALNLRESGLDVRVGLRPGKSWDAAKEDGLPVLPVPAAAEEGDIIMILVNDEFQAALYQESVESLAREIAEVSPADRMRRRGLVLSYLMRFKQICNHPSQWLGDGAYAAAESGKLARLAEIAEVVASRQEKALVFTQFRELTAPLARFLEEAFGRQGLVLSGETRIRERAELVRRFQEDEAIPFFVLSLKAGGTGLNLTAATHVIHFDRWWNPAVENQATDRAFRIGQKKAVLVHKLVCRGTVEERIDAMLEEKQKLSRDLLEGGDEVRLTELDDRALLELVSLDLRSATSDT